VADAINRCLQNLCITCAREEGVGDYFHIGVIAYGARVGPAFGGSLSGRDLVPLSEIAVSPARVDSRTKKVNDGAGGLVEQTVKFPVWFDAQANGGTPMCQALEEARRVVQGWVDQHPDCFPPVVINITDGESTDGDPAAAAAAVRAVGSSDGEALLFNAHVSSNRATPVEFPADDAGLPTGTKQLRAFVTRLLLAGLLRCPSAHASMVGPERSGRSRGHPGREPRSPRAMPRPAGESVADLAQEVPHLRHGRRVGSPRTNWRRPHRRHRTYCPSAITSRQLV
jgi:hypothetical protein